jgi:hypothetical protein
MKKTDGIWILIIVLISSLFLIPATRSLFETATGSHPYLMGFVKTAILASMGELMANRIRTGLYFSKKGMVAKFFVWGFLGMVFVLIFKLYASGVANAQEAGLLPSIVESGFPQSLLTAFLISFLMNITFAPTFMIFHRITDGFIELGEGNPVKIIKIKGSQVIERINWNYFFNFVVLKTIPFFWIPAHTVTFLLPENYRVLMAAYLSIALGIILSLSNSKRISAK